MNKFKTHVWVSNTNVQVAERLHRGWTATVWLQTRVGILRHVQTGIEVWPASQLTKTGGSFFWGRRVGVWTRWPSFSGVEVKNSWSFMSLPRMSLHHLLLIPSRNCTISRTKRGINEFFETALACRSVYLQVALSDVWHSVYYLVIWGPINGNCFEIISSLELR